jgi:hypothetical protein
VLSTARLEPQRSRFANIFFVGKRIAIGLLLAAAGGLAGFFALTIAVQNEPNLPVPLIAILSPGLKIAEILIPIRRESLGTLGPTFGGFLRVAIGVNAAFYSAIFAFFAAFVARLLRRQSR